MSHNIAHCLLRFRIAVCQLKRDEFVDVVSLSPNEERLLLRWNCRAVFETL